MDEDKLNELKKETEVENSRLEELLKQEITPDMQREFLLILKESQLYLPVTFSADIFDNLEGAEEGDVFETTGREGFDINYLTDEEGNLAVPLFTGDEAMEEAGLASSVMVMFTSDIADMLKQTEKYSTIVINPFTSHDINMPIQAFLALFVEASDEEKEFLETMEAIIEILREKYTVLDKETLLYVRDSEPFMKEVAEDGVFSPIIPFNASTRWDFHDELDYLHILVMPEKSKVVFTGIEDDNVWDTIIAPGSEFEHVEDPDEFTSVWKCRAQPFYDE